MPFTLAMRPKSQNFDLIDSDIPDAPIGQVIGSAEGFTVYLHGDLEALLPPAGTSEAALEEFEAWAASNEGWHGLT